MKEITLALLAAAALLVIGICIGKKVRKSKTLRSVTYRSQFGYALTMASNGGHVSVTYRDDGKAPLIKNADKCYAHIVDILDTYDFRSWRNLSDKAAVTDGVTSLEIRCENGKVYFFSQSQELPEKAREIFSVIRSCLMEYAGIVK